MMKNQTYIRLLKPLLLGLLLMTESKAQTTLQVVTKSIEKTFTATNIIVVEAEKADIERSNGLSGIKNMDLNEGVAFIFEKPGQKVFWMKDMLFPLDFVYIHKDRVVEVKENVLPSSYPNTIVNQMPASIIIELNAGQVKLKNIKVGDVLELDSD